ncbi:MAG: serine hydrolase domain-containing protein [Gemmatimonadota bacterium]
MTGCLAANKLADREYFRYTPARITIPQWTKMATRDAMIQTVLVLRRRAPLLLAVALSAGCVDEPPAAAGQAGGAGIADSVRLPDSETGRQFPVFLAAYNAGRLDALRAYFDEVAGDSARAADLAAYWMGVHNEYGPVALELVDTTRTWPWYWVRGRATRTWAVFDVGFGDGPDRGLTSVGVARGIRPPGLGPPPAIVAERLPELLGRYLESVEAGGHFSGAVSVAKDGETIFEGAYGSADRRHGVPNRLDTRFPLASLTKMLTAVAVLQLVERGDIALSDRLGQLVPEYPDRIGSQVTVRHLLTHTSGIELDDHPPFNRQVERARSVEEMLQAQLDHIDELNQGPVEEFELPDGFDYTNEGYDLLGVIVARVSGRSWPDYVREHVLEPAGMSRTGFVRDVPVADVATGYTRGSNHPEGRRRENHFLLSPFARPSGNAFATAGDVVRFLEAVRTGRLLGPELARAATSPQVPWVGQNDTYYGLGFQIVDADGVRYYGHGGSQPGVSARAYVYPDRGYTVVILSNHADAAWHVAAYVHRLVVGVARSGDTT